MNENQKDRLVIKKRKKSTSKDSAVIRVDSPTYCAVAGLAMNAGISMQELASTLIAFALERVDVVEE